MLSSDLWARCAFLPPAGGRAHRNRAALCTPIYARNRRSPALSSVNRRVPSQDAECSNVRHPPVRKDGPRMGELGPNPLELVTHPR